MAVTDSPGAGRVYIALAQGPLVAEPTWTRYDNLSGVPCYGFDSYAGRQSELDTTDTGTATVYYHDLNGTLDTDSLVGLQILLQLYNPVTATWHPRWRGHVDDITYDLIDIPSLAKASNVQLICTGIFDYLGGCKMLPGIFGDPGGPDDVVFYEDGRVDDRVTALLTDAQLDPSMTVVFSGNVDVNETLYDPDDVVLQGLRDAADAEFPGVANVYEDRFGRTAFHGRKSRIDPETTAASASNWDFHTWAAATREDVGTGTAQIQSFSYNRPRARIINSYLAWPRADENGDEFDRTLIPTLLQTSASSIGTFGYRGNEAPDLIIKQNFNNSDTGAEQCTKFGQFYVENYAQPRKAVQRVVLTSLRPGDRGASATWDLLTRCDISDRMVLTVDEASLAAEAFFLDGIAVECRPANPSYDFVTITPNLTPASFYGTDIFDDDA